MRLDKSAIRTNSTAGRNTTTVSATASVTFQLVCSPLRPPVRPSARAHIDSKKLTIIDTGCVGYWCPCILYSRTHHRLKTSPNSNLNDFHNCNGHCITFCVLGPISCNYPITSPPPLPPSSANKKKQGSFQPCNERAFAKSTDWRARWLAIVGRRIVASCAH